MLSCFCLRLEVMIIFKVLGFIILVFAICLAIVIYTIMNRLRKATENFKQQMGGEKTQQNSQRYNAGSHSAETIIDSCIPERAEKKIIPKSEGEYVDVEEEK